MNLENKRSTIPYGRHSISESDIESVCRVLRSDWLTTGPMVPAFEEKMAGLIGVDYCVAVSSGTAALHAAMHAIGVGPGDEVIVPPLTFAATANAVLYQGATPVFADVDAATLLINPESVNNAITSKTRAVIAMDYAGQLCDYDALKNITRDRGILLVADACHSLGARYKGISSGVCADLSVFSFHPVKQITTGEGGMVVTGKKEFAQRARQFRNHGINADLHQREEKNTWYYEIDSLGYNYRLSDIQCALGISQLETLTRRIEKRNAIAGKYNAALSELSGVSPLKTLDHNYHAYHLYVIRFDLGVLEKTREEIFIEMKNEGVGVNVHYIPVYYHPIYRKKFGLKPGLCPVAEAAYERILTLPVYPDMTDLDVQRVCKTLEKLIA